MLALTTTTPASSPAAVRTQSSARPPAKRSFPLFRALAALIVLVAASMFEPHCFRFAFKHLLRLEAWRCGIDAQMRAVEGSLFEPVTLRDSVWIYESGDGPISRLEIETARAEFSWRDLFSRGAAPWFQRLTVEGLRGKVELPIETPIPERPGFRLRLPGPQSRWIPGPERIEARDVNLIFQSDGDYVRLEGAEFAVSEASPAGSPSSAWPSSSRGSTEPSTACRARRSSTDRRSSLRASR